jgi:hypothetical protein
LVQQKQTGGAFDMEKFTANLEQKYLEASNKISH